MCDGCHKGHIYSLSLSSQPRLDELGLGAGGQINLSANDDILG